MDGTVDQRLEGVAPVEQPWRSRHRSGLFIRLKSTQRTWVLGQPVDCPTELVTQKYVSHISQEVGGNYQFEWFTSEFEPLTARCSGGGGREQLVGHPGRIWFGYAWPQSGTDWPVHQPGMMTWRLGTGSVIGELIIHINLFKMLKKLPFYLIRKLWGKGYIKIPGASLSKRCFQRLSTEELCVQEVVTHFI